jgi:hypothetical protein
MKKKNTETVIVSAGAAAVAGAAVAALFSGAVTLTAALALASCRSIESSFGTLGEADAPLTYRQLMHAPIAAFLPEERDAVLTFRASMNRAQAEQPALPRGD